MSWSRDQVDLLLEEYAKQPCLYAVKTKAYSNKHLRQSALEAIENVLKLLKPSVTISEIKTKFMGLKNTFLMEYRKHKKSLHSGGGEEEVYHPTLWYYEKMMFLLEHIEPRSAIDSMDTETLIQSENENDVVKENTEDVTEYYVENNGTVEKIYVQTYSEETQQSSNNGCSTSITANTPTSVYEGVSHRNKKRRTDDSDVLVYEGYQHIEGAHKCRSSYKPT